MTTKYHHLTDAEMLDWISVQGDEFSFGIIVDAPGDGNFYVHGLNCYGTGKTFRDAINAARAAQGDANG